MVASDIELRWDPGRSNWKRNQRRYVRPIINAALDHATEGVDHFNLNSPAKYVTLCRGVNTNKEYGISDEKGLNFELYIPVDAIRFHRLEPLLDLYAQVVFHEHVHCARTQYFELGTLREHAVTEGLAYCGTQLFANALSLKDEYDTPIDFMKTMSTHDLRELRKNVFEADKKLGSVSARQMGEGSDYYYWANVPQVHYYSCTEAIGIRAVASLLDKGRSIVDLLPLSAEEILDVA